jgi:uncharacterized Zn finger protein (UPF0148 family)
MSKVIAKQIDHILRGDKFLRHKKNAKGSTAIYSRNHPTAKFVRVVVDSGIDLTSGKASNQIGIKLVYINRQKGWRVITTEIFATAKKLASTIKAQEAAEKFVKSCKFCKAKKFKAKTGNTVCANACWTAWAGKKKSEKTTKKSSQKVTAKSSRKKTAQKMTQSAARKSSQRKGQKNLQRFTQEILPGDLVTIEKHEGTKLLQDLTGSILGIVQYVSKLGSVKTVWTANSVDLPEWLLPTRNAYVADAIPSYRFKVLSRQVEWVKVA